MKDQDGADYSVNFFSPPGEDMNAVVARHIATMDKALAKREFEKLVAGA
jgi:hypothetical protein